MTGIFSIGVGAMQAAQLGLVTAEHNISNANTPGYTRQRTIQATNVPIMTGAGAVGRGTHVATIERMYSEFLTGQVNTSQTNVSELETYYAQIKQIDNMLADPNAGLSPALQGFFKGVQTVAANPALSSSRQAMVSSAQTLVNRFQGIQTRLDDITQSINSQISGTVDAINSYAKQIASLNERVVLAQAATNQPPNDLMDTRDQLVSELNKLIKVSTTTNSDGSYSVFMGTGQQLVVGPQTMTLTAGPSNEDPSRTVVGMRTGGSKNLELPEDVLVGGQLGGLVRFRSESLDRAANEMGRVAASMAMTFNAQHALGQDLDGNIAGDGLVTDFFDMTNMGPQVTQNAKNTGTAVLTAGFVLAGAYTVEQDGGGSYLLRRQSDGASVATGTLASLQTNPAVIAAGVDLSGISVDPGKSTAVYSSTGTPSNVFSNLTISDYRLSYDGTNYTMTRLNDGRTWSDTDSVALSSAFSASEGFAFELSVPPNAGDSFFIQPTENAARNIALNTNIAADPKLIAVAGALRGEAATINTGTGKISNGAAVTGFSSSSAGLGSTLTYNAGNLSFPLPGLDVMATLPDGTVTQYPAGTSIPYDATKGIKLSFAGISVEISGQPNNGDQFKILANAGAVADGRNGLALGKLQTQATMAGGKANYQDAYAQFVSSNGTRTQEAKVTAEAQQALLEQAQNARDSMSGVSLEEEAANLLRYQQAYQAAAKMLQIGGTLFDAILAIR